MSHADLRRVVLAELLDDTWPVCPRSLARYLWREGRVEGTCHGACEAIEDILHELMALGLLEKTDGHYGFQYRPRDLLTALTLVAALQEPLESQELGIAQTELLPQ